MTDLVVDLRRTIAAPRERVFRTLLDPELLVRWLHPDTFEVVHAEVDERVGGRHLVEHLDADGERHAFDSVIEELVPPERLVLAFAFVGRGLREETELTLTLQEAPAGGTELRLVQRLRRTDPFDERSVTTGWNQALDHLEALHPRST